MPTSEQISLRWNEFQKNATAAFGSLRKDSDFADVTLLCEDGQYVEAHKVILAASSPVFQNMLNKAECLEPFQFAFNGHTNQVEALNLKKRFFYYFFFCEKSFNTLFVVCLPLTLHVWAL